MVDCNEHIKLVLDPRRFPGMSSKMMAIIGFLLETDYTNPSLCEIVVTSDGYMLGRIEGDIGCNELIGTIEDFKRNWDNLIHIHNLGLLPEEIKYLEMLPNVMIRNYNG